jgi:hypothetical protein
MRKTKILIKSFEELSKCFPQEEIEFAYHQIASVFSEEEVSYWIGSGIEMEAYIIEEDDIYSSMLGYALLADKAVKDNKIFLNPNTWKEI